MVTTAWDLIPTPLERHVTHKTSTTQFVSLAVALEHVEARERAPKLALVRALASGVRSRGFVRYAWPPYHEGEEQLSPELFTDYPPQHGPARIDWAEGTAVMGDGHPHPACTVYGLEVHRADLLARWPGPLKGAAKSRRLSKRLVQQVERASGRPVTSITRDGVTFNFAQPEPGAANNPWLDDLKVAKQ
jgi:hypothetical protein